MGITSCSTSMRKQCPKKLIYTDMLRNMLGFCSRFHPQMSSSKAEAASSNHDRQGIQGDPSLDHPRPLTQKLRHLTVPKGTLFSSSIILFIILQVAYIILAAFCLVKPLPLRVITRFTDAEIIGGFTVVFVVWQKVAISVGQYIADDILDHERPAAAPPPAASQATKAGGEMEKISSLILGFIPWHVIHISRGRSTRKFKLALLASLSIFALSSLAPGAINTATTLIDTPTTIQIARLLSEVQQNEAQAIVTTQSRANLILRLEMIEHSPFGFKLQPNMLAPLPRVNLMTFNTTVEYDSDVIEFHHHCHWEAPQFFNVSGSIIITSAGHQWAGATVGVGPVNVGSSVGPLSLTSFVIMEAVGTSAFIFSGGNSSILDRRFNPPVPFAVDLGSLPATFTPQGAGLDIASNSLYAPLSSVLVCDPRTTITGGRVRVTNDGTLTVVASGRTPIGNIPQSAANLIFTNAFQVALVEVETLGTANVVNNIASTMFMANSSTVDWNQAHNIRPLDLSSISENMDAFMLTAAKAFIDGYRKNGTSLAVNFELDTVSAMEQREGLALSTSIGLFVSTTVFVVIVAVLLFLLHLYHYFMGKHHERVPDSPTESGCEKLANH